MRREVVLFASELWDGETVPLRECVYQLQQSVSLRSCWTTAVTDFHLRQWDKLDTGVPCPISFSHAEIEAHLRASEGWNERANFWSALDGFVSKDGCTSIDNYDEARKIFEGLRESGLTHLSGTELAEFEEESRWAKRSR